MKTCSCCKETKSFDAFSHNKARSGGYNNNCKSCEKIRGREYRLSNIEKERRRRGLYLAANKEKVYEGIQRWRKNNKDKIYGYDRAYKDRNRALLALKARNKVKTELDYARAAELSRRWRKENPDKKKAHYLVEQAVKKGNLLRPKSCETCLLPVPTQAHHTDYAKPLQVVWLCCPCHMLQHRKS